MGKRTKPQIKQLETLEKIPESEIDTSDIPEWTDEMFRKAKRGSVIMPKLIKKKSNR